MNCRISPFVYVILSVVFLFLGLSAVVQVKPKPEAATPSRPLTIQIDDIATVTLPLCNPHTEGDILTYYRHDNPTAVTMGCVDGAWTALGATLLDEPTTEKPQPKKDKV
jgi:hypothetical protein